MNKNQNKFNPRGMGDSKSVFRWAGSKRQILDQLICAAPTRFKRYIEPFAGSACLFFALRPEEAILGDINSDLIATYRQLRRSPTKLFEAVHAIPRSSEEYYRQRALDPTALTAFQRGVRFLYLNRNCFNGVYRLNRRGEFNVPYGTRTGEVPGIQVFRDCARALKSAELMSADFEAVTAQAKRGDFVYLDPPYSTSVEGEPGLYGAGAFARIDLDRLVAALKRLDRVGAKYLLSFEDAPELRKKLSPNRCIPITARRHVAGFSGARGIVSELLFTNQ